MKKAFLFFFILITFTSFNKKEKWKNLLDKNLSEWGMYLSFSHADSYNGAAPENDKGELIQPVGYNKNEKNVFSVTEENNEPVLKISGEIYGCLFTNEEYGNYHLKMKIKWGQKKWVPRLDKLKDAGICYHSIGEAGADYWRSWMVSQEFQIMEGHMGDYWNIGSSAIDVRAFIPEGNMNTVAGNKQSFLPIGTGTALPGFCLRTENRESTNTEWTEIELICFNGKSLHIVNGKVVMVLARSRYIKDGKEVPLTKGKIQLQSEAAEVFYKNIMIKNIDQLPPGYESYFQ